MPSEASAALLCATAFLVAADQGMYVMAALLIALVAVAIDNRRHARYPQEILACVVLDCGVLGSRRSRN